MILGKKYIIVTHCLLQKTEYNWKLQFLNLKVIINIQHYFFIFITENVQNKSNPSLIEKIRSVKYCLCFLFSMMWANIFFWRYKETIQRYAKYCERKIWIRPILTSKKLKFSRNDWLLNKEIISEVFPRSLFPNKRQQRFEIEKNIFHVALNLWNTFIENFYTT